MSSVGALSEWKLTDQENKFLNSEFSSKFLYQFVLCGKFKLYGSPMTMATKSKLLETYLEKITDQKEEYELMNFVELGEKPLLTVWLYLNGFDPSNKFTTLSLSEFIEMLNVINYLDCDLTDKWLISFKVKIYQVKKSELRDNSQSVISVLNKLTKLDPYKVLDIVEYLTNNSINEITDKLDYVLLSVKNPYSSPQPVGLIERRLTLDEKWLVTALGKYGYDKTENGRYRKVMSIDGSSRYYDLNVKPNVITLVEPEPVYQRMRGN